MAALTTIMLGNIIVDVIDKKKALNWAENIAISFLIGQGALTLLLFFSLFIPLPKRILIISVIITAGFMVKLILSGKKLFAKRVNLFNPLTKYPRIFNLKSVVIILILAGILFKLSYVFVEACSKPEYSWDASNNWTLCAKNLYFIDQQKPDQMLSVLKSSGNYPKLIPNMHFWFFSWMGQANDPWSKIIFPLTMLSFMIFFYESLKIYIGRIWALIFSYFLLSSPFFLYHATIGYADFVIAVYFCLGAICFYRWIREKNDVFFWLFTISTALTAWIKLEGKTFYGLGLIILGIYLWMSYRGPLRAKISKLAQYLAAYLLIAFPWQAFTAMNHMSSREILAFNLSYFFEVHMRAYQMLFMQGTWGLLWIGILAAICYYGRRLLAAGNIYLSLVLLLFYLRVLFVYLFTLNSYGWFEITFNRLWLSIYPLAIFSVALIVPKTWDWHNKERS
jgi:hypothetical protein